MVDITAAAVRQVLADANDQALKGNFQPLEAHGLELISLLEQDDCPKTYLAVLTILLVARTLYDSETLDVLHIKKRSDPKGYSAPSIGSEVAVFAKDHLIDLRATSQQPMNNQPFTYKEKIELDMGARSTNRAHWAAFYSLAIVIQKMSPENSGDALANIFNRRRKVARPQTAYQVYGSSLDQVQAFTSELTGFVDNYSDLGRVGQALAAAVYDSIYGQSNVQLGNAQDPDASKVGDVHVTSENGHPWLWVEVKQQAVQTGAVQGFVEKAIAAGAQRLAYLAFRNHAYSSHIDARKIRQTADKNQILVHVFLSAEEFIHWGFSVIPGQFGEQMARLIERLDARLSESGVSAEVFRAFKTLVDPYADSISD